ncbi:winged helix-turn-helix domain-containing protein [Micrococcoides hystricis]|uniref:Winged helix-turn-helix domain-containing protein n=1 Tax=Micrococcoides hystricis TaxID=1572761 RepID=A0ABV6PA37_9MICC
MSAAESLVAGQLRLDRTARRVFVDHREKSLTPRAFALLEFLMSHPDEVFSRQRLLETVWGFESIVTTRAVDHRVAEIRKVIGEVAPGQFMIETVSGEGYRFAAEVERA